MPEVKIEGVEKLISQLRALNQDIPGAVGRGLYRGGQKVMAISQERYVPVDTGALRSSGHVTEPAASPSGVSITLGYGGPAAGYAIFVHENLNAKHTTGQAKYLETPLNENLGEIEREIVGELNRLMESL
jgi:hypothetical protein